MFFWLHGEMVVMLLGGFEGMCSAQWLMGWLRSLLDQFGAQMCTDSLCRLSVR